MSKNKYNWWEDPKNRDEVRKISWWNHEENKTVAQIPIAVIQSDNVWVAATNDETKNILGDRLTGSCQGETKEEAIMMLLELLKWSHEYSEECRLRYQRWVPFRKGDWSHIGGKWFIIFGIHFNFRYGKNMKGGWYVPFTKLNISIHSEWSSFRRYKATNSSTTIK